MAYLEIPEQVGAILLPNIVSFPHGALPLHIFEPRYRKMLDDAIETNSMICIANLQDEETSDLSKCTAKVGTLGLIRVSRKQDDGNSSLILHSISRVEFVSWEKDINDTHPYPRANIKPLSSDAELVTNATRLIIESLRDATSRFLAQLPGDLTVKIDTTLDRVNDDLGTLTDVVAQQFVSNTDLRQTLLEEVNPSKRAESLIRHLRLQKITL